MKKLVSLSLIFIFFWLVLSYSYYQRIDFKKARSALQTSNNKFEIKTENEVENKNKNKTDIDKAIINFSASEPKDELKEDVLKGVYWSRRKPSEKPFFYSICYLHGFSASRKELSPIIELVGDTVGAPVVFTRLQGHGYKDMTKMTKATVNGWFNDAKDCYDLASKIGEKVILIGTSTGAALATLLSIHYKEAHKLVFLSPNFKIGNKFFPLLSGPLGPMVARLFFGKEREIPHIYNEDFRYYWSTKYPSSVLSTLADLLRNLDYNKFKEVKAPLLIISTPHDKIIDLNELRKYALTNRAGDTIWEHREDVKNHNLAGDIVDPSKNEDFIKIISNFISKH